MRAAVIRECGLRCCDPEHVKGSVIGVIDLDHVRELSDGGKPFDRANVLLRCRSCHSRKTKAIAAARMEADYWRRMAAEGH